jgi:hypothetical protein
MKANRFARTPRERMIGAIWKEPTSTRAQWERKAELVRLLEMKPHLSRADIEAELAAARNAVPAVAVIDGVHVVKRVNKDGDVFWTDHMNVTVLLKRGWKRPQIDELLGAADKERHVRYAHRMRLFSVTRVIAAEQSPRFRRKRGAKPSVVTLRAERS